MAKDHGSLVSWAHKKKADGAWTWHFGAQMTIWQGKGAYLSWVDCRRAHFWVWLCTFSPLREAAVRERCLARRQQRNEPERMPGCRRKLATREVGFSNLEAGFLSAEAGSTVETFGEQLVSAITAPPCPWGWIALL